MSKRLTGLHPLAYMGVEADMPPNMYLAKTAPTATDSRNFNLGDMWLDTSTQVIYVLVSLSGGFAVWQSASGAFTFITDNGTATASGDIIQLLGDGATIETTASGNTIHVSLDGGSNGQIIVASTLGSPQWATLLTDGSITVTTGPNSLELGVDSTVVIGNGTNGQLLIGGGSAPEWASLTSDGSIIFTPGVNSLELSAPNATGLTTVHTDSGTATQAAGAITIAGDGSMIDTSGSGSTVTVAIKSGTDGQLIIGKTGGPAAWGNLTSMGATVVITEGANTINLEATGGGSSGASTFITDSGNALENLGDITIAGGSNISTSGAGQTVTINVADTTNHAVQVGNSGGSLTSLGVGTNGQVLIGSSSANPAFSTITSTGGTITFTAGAHTLNMEAVGGGGGGGAIITTFMSSGTWTKNTNTKYVTVMGWNGGGGGGSGGGGTGSGGGGGGAGSFFKFSGPEQFFGSSESVTVGVGGSGGAGVTGTASGNNGTEGTASSFGAITAPISVTSQVPRPSSTFQNGFGSPLGGAATTSSGGVFIDGLPRTTYLAAMNAQSYDAVPSNGTAGTSGAAGGDGGFGGGTGPTNYPIIFYQGTAGGGGASTTNGGNGGSIYALNGATILSAGGTGGGVNSSGTAGNDYPTSGGLIYGGTGGGGGGAGNPAGDGGKGGFPGGGGGGGGKSTVGVSGDGGDGGDGIVMVIEFT